MDNWNGSPRSSEKNLEWGQGEKKNKGGEEDLGNSKLDDVSNDAHHTAN